jgi:hypothetical protein
MTASNFIQTQLNEMVSSLPTIKVAHEFDEFDNSHFVQIWPKSLFYDNLFNNLKTKLRIEFIKWYPNHSLGFTTEGKLYELENPTFTLQGADYQLQASIFSADSNFIIPQKNNSQAQKNQILANEKYYINNFELIMAA